MLFQWKNMCKFIHRGKKSLGWWSAQSNTCRYHVNVIRKKKNTLNKDM